MNEFWKLFLAFLSPYGTRTLNHSFIHSFVLFISAESLAQRRLDALAEARDRLALTEAATEATAVKLAEAEERVDELTNKLGAKSAKVENMKRLLLASEAGTPFKDLDKTLRDCDDDDDDNDDDGNVFNFDVIKRNADAADARPTKKSKVSDGGGHLAIDHFH